MYFTTHTIIEADHRRQALLDEAANHRLAKLARAGRRDRHRTAPSVPLPARAEPDRAKPDRTAPDRTRPDHTAPDRTAPSQPGLPQPARSVADRAA